MMVEKNNKNKRNPKVFIIGCKLLAFSTATAITLESYL